jgi:hypothetical protein
MDIFKPLNFFLIPAGLNLFTENGLNIFKRFLSLIFILAHATCIASFLTLLPTMMVLQLFSECVLNHAFGIIFIIVHARAQKSMEEFLKESNFMLTSQQKEKLKKRSKIMAVLSGITIVIAFADYFYQAYLSYRVGMTSLAMTSILEAVTYLNHWSFVGVCEFLLFVMILMETEEKFFKETQAKLVHNSIAVHDICMQRFRMRERQERLNSMFGIITLLWFVSVFFDVTCVFLYASSSNKRLIEVSVVMPLNLIVWSIKGYIVFVTQSCINLVKERSANLYRQVYHMTKGNVVLSELRAELEKPYTFDAWGVFELDIPFLLGFLAAVISYLTLAIGLSATINPPKT